MLRVLLLATLARLSTGVFDPELHAKYLQLPRDEFIRYFNSQNYSWKIRHHPHLDNVHHNCTIINDLSLTGIELKRHSYRTYAQLPDNFDSREHWPDCQSIKDVHDQATCGSCWAFATATTASDRTCIDKGLNIRLSVQDLECVTPLCDGGDPQMAFQAWCYRGLVSQECKPYKGSSSGCVKSCKDPTVDYQKDKHYGENIYQISPNDNDIKADLFTNGPVSAGFTVYEDFHDYKSGVYEHKYGGYAGGHAVRVIGYGVENGVDYWLAVNSWGPTWGDKGLFKIKRFQKMELPFESYMFSGHAKTQNL